MKDIKRLSDYQQDHCWQYDKRLMNLSQDLKTAGFSKAYVKNLRVKDFQFEIVTDKGKQQELKRFVEKYEWVGTIGQRTTHYFAARHSDTGILAGVILFSVPNGFSKLLGEGTDQVERLISRGASISWSPKNLASAFLTWCIRWMVNNTGYRLFTAYADPTAKELGVIYQACNFFYLGKGFGTSVRYINPYTGKLVSDRFFRQKTAYRKYAEELGIQWNPNWQHSTGMNWHLVPNDVEQMLRQHSKKKQSESKKVEYPSKHKYAYVLGRTATETRILRKLFEKNNVRFEYPKERVPKGVSIRLEREPRSFIDRNVLERELWLLEQKVKAIQTLLKLY